MSALVAPPTRDLDTCDREPIHVPGSIQSHGVLLAFEPASKRITHASRNAETLFGRSIDEIIGAAISEIAGDAAALATAPAEPEPGQVATPVRAFGVGLAGVKGAFNTSSHIYAGSAVLEIEPATAAPANAPLDIVRGLLAKLQQTKTLPELCTETAVLLRGLIRFDRVMIYRFLHDGSGQVIAESHAPGIESLLHLRYPASDIPRQARELYKKNWVRLIADVQAPTTPIASTGRPHELPLDLSFSELRSVSPIHIEYLRNMGVGASMSISIVVNGELWGLIACHHRTRRHVEANIRAAAEILGQVFSLQIQAIEGIEAYVTMRAARTLLDRVVAEFPVGGDVIASLDSRLGQLSSFIVSDGAALLVDGVFRGTGRTPTADEARTLAARLAHLRGGSIFCTHKISDELPEAAHWASGIKGVLAIPISYSDPNYLFFFRTEVLQTLDWAGNPDKAATISANGRISPRKSFEAWKQEVRDQSLPWSARERLIGETMRVYLCDIIIRFSDVIKQERRHAEQRNRLVVNELNHRVKGTLELIQSLVVHGYEEPGKVQEFVRTLEGRIKTIALAHDATSVAHGAEIGALIERAIALHSIDAGRIDIAGPDVRLDAKAFTALALVVHELITNSVHSGALRYSAGRLVVRWQRDGEGSLMLHWEETGGLLASKSRDELSLAIIRRNIPHLLGGSADVEMHGSGLRASFKIPHRHVVEEREIARTVTEQRRPQIAAPTRGLEGVSVLIVEDQVPTAFDLEQLLYAHGAAAVAVVATVAAAQAHLERELPDVAILDVDLGNETSMPIAESLTRLSIPFIFAAGQSDLDQIRPSFREVDVLLKPWSGDTAVRLVKDALLPHLISAVLSRLV